MKKSFMLGMLWICLAGLPLRGWAAPAEVNDVSGDASKNEDYRLRAGDRIAVKIFPDDPYIKGGEMQVTPEGNITLPLVGKVEVAGKTISEAQQELVRLIDADYIVNPEVVIEVSQFKEQSFVIMGQVQRPGRYDFPKGATRLTLLQAVSIAGGFSDIANIKKIKIIRRDGGESRIIKANAEAIISGEEKDVELHPEDVVNVSESLF